MNQYTHNIFGALMHRRTNGVIMEFSLWCATCFVALMSMIAFIAGYGEITWGMMFFFAIGLGVIQGFRLKGVAMLYGAAAFPFFVEVLHYMTFGQGDYEESYSVMNTLLFVIALLLSIAVITCMSIHGFSKIDLGTVTTILLIVNVAVLFLLHIMIYATVGIGGYWFGTICFWMLLAIVLLEYIFCIWGPMDLERGRANKGKIIKKNNQTYRRR